VARIITRGTLNDFVRNRVEPGLQPTVKDHLDAWYALVSHTAWRNSSHLKRQFHHASVISAERVAFIIEGNRYRLVVAVDYRNAVVLVLWLGSHQEFDRIDVRQVKFEKERYADSSGSH
jgi:mRNA interferase HigB